MGALQGYGLQAIAGLSGIRTILAKIFLKLIIKALKRFEVLQEQKKSAEKKLEDYDKVINKPDATKEEIRDAANDFLK